MLIRALIVLLLVLNLGVAAWWLSRPMTPASPPLPAQPAGVPRLQLSGEPGAAVTTARSVSPAVAPVQAVSVAAEAGGSRDSVAVSDAPASRCYALGPFADAASTQAALTRITGQTTRRRTREAPGSGASGYNVFLPPSADREIAQALAQRIGAAGFDDYLVINSGDQLNGIALGRYRSRESAERRQSALTAAGFAAQLQPIGQEGATQWWLEVEAAADASGPQLKASAASAQSRSLDCAGLR